MNRMRGDGPPPSAPFNEFLPAPTPRTAMFGSPIKTIFGDKAKRDLKEVQPLVESIKASSPSSKR